MSRILKFLLLSIATIPMPAFAGSGPTPVLAQDVGVCDPFHPQNCLQPLANGSINVNATVTPGPPIPAVYTATGQCMLSVTTTATSISACSGGIPANTNYAAICNSGDPAVWRQDGIAPTAAIGNPLSSGTFSSPSCEPFYTPTAALEWISQTTNPIVLSIAFYQIH